VPITLAAEVETEAHVQLTRRGLKTFLREGQSALQRAGQQVVADALLTTETLGVQKPRTAAQAAARRRLKFPR
jgi:hypothetical protein